MTLGSAHIGTAVFLGLAVAAALSFVPSIVARMRHHHSTRSIFLLNLFLGWSLIAWVGALYWACTNPHSRHEAPPPSA